MAIDEREGWWLFDYSNINIKSSAHAAMFTEGNHDYNNDDTIILASAITLKELQKKEDYKCNK